MALRLTSGYGGQAGNSFETSGLRDRLSGSREAGSREAGPAEFGRTAAGVGSDFASVRHNYLGRRRPEQAVAKPTCERFFYQAVFAAVETDDSDSPGRPQTEWGHPQQLFERAKLIVD